MPEFGFAAETRIDEIISVMHPASNTLLEPMSEGQFIRAYPDWETKTGRPRFYMRQRPGVLAILPHPPTAETGVLSVQWSLVPTRTSTGADEGIIEENWEALINGTIGKILMISGMSWSNPALGAAKWNTYELATTTAAGKAERNSGRVVREVHYGGL